MFPFGFVKSNVNPTVSVDWGGELLSRTRAGATCHATLKFDADGDKYKSNNQGNFSAAYKTWLTLGLNSEIWVERTINSGTLAVDTIGGSRVLMTSDRALGIVKTSSGIGTANITVDFYDAASDGNLLATGTLNLSAEYE